MVLIDSRNIMLQQATEKRERYCSTGFNFIILSCELINSHMFQQVCDNFCYCHSPPTCAYGYATLTTYLPQCSPSYACIYISSTTLVSIYILLRAIMKIPDVMYIHISLSLCLLLFYWLILEI